MRTPGQPTRVLVVDDSALMRQLLTTLLAADPDIEVVGTAPDPYVARDRIKALDPDVVTLDIEMPRMDGLSFLRKIMALRPVPVVMISTLTQANSETTIQALEIGAVDFIAKPSARLSEAMDALGDELRAKVKAAAGARLRARPETPAPAPHAPARAFGPSHHVVFIGASTGGVEALSHLVRELPADGPPVLITQHMPERFTTSFANRLNTTCAATVVEASADQTVLPGHVYIAPGSHHLEVARVGSRLVCRLNLEPPVSGHRPSVDVLFRSAARVVGRDAVGVILTGMGKDGAEGLLQMRHAQAMTLGQDEASSLIYGMPRAAFERGAVARQFPLDAMAGAILDYCAAAPSRASAAGRMR